MTDSTSPLDDTQTFETLPETISIGSVEMVPLQDGTGAWIRYEIPGSCEFNLVVPEDAIAKFIQARRAMVAKRIQVARIAPRKIPGVYDNDRFPNLKKY